MRYRLASMLPGTKRLPSTDAEEVLVALEGCLLVDLSAERGV